MDARRVFLLGIFATACPPVQRVGPQLSILGAAEAQVLKVLADIVRRQVAPDVVPLGIFQDAGDDPGLLHRATVAQYVADLFVADVIIPEEIGALAGMVQYAHCDLPLWMILRQCGGKDKSPGGMDQGQLERNPSPGPVVPYTGDSSLQQREHEVSPE